MQLAAILWCCCNPLLPGFPNILVSLSSVNASFLGQVRAHSLASSQLFVLMQLEQVSLIVEIGDEI